jgi:hypothetical protein
MLVSGTRVPAVDVRSDHPHHRNSNPEREPMLRPGAWWSSTTPSPQGLITDAIPTAFAAPCPLQNPQRPVPRPCRATSAAPEASIY